MQSWSDIPLDDVQLGPGLKRMMPCCLALTFLDLSATKIGDTDFGGVRHLKHLRVLRASYTCITGKGGALLCESLCTMPHPRPSKNCVAASRLLLHQWTALDLWDAHIVQLHMNLLPSRHRSQARQSATFMHLTSKKVCKPETLLHLIHRFRS